MKHKAAQKISILLLICSMICSCNKKPVSNGNSIIINEDVAKEIREYYDRNKISLCNEYILNISSNKQKDTTELSLYYSLDLRSILKTHPSIYGYLDSIPYIYFTGDENIYKLNNDSNTFQIFISQVFNNQYTKYVVKKENFPPPPTGVNEIIRLYIFNNKLIRKEYDNNIAKDTREIKSNKKTTGSNKLDSLLNLK